MATSVLAFTQGQGICYLPKTSFSTLLEVREARRSCKICIKVLPLPVRDGGRSTCVEFGGFNTDLFRSDEDVDVVQVTHSFLHVQVHEGLDSRVDKDFQGIGDDK